MKIRSYQDLDTWKLGMEIAEDCYRVTLGVFVNPILENCRLLGKMLHNQIRSFQLENCSRQRQRCRGVMGNNILSPLPTPLSPLPTPHSPLPTADCPLPTATIGRRRFGPAFVRVEPVEDVFERRNNHVAVIAAGDFDVFDLDAKLFAGPTILRDSSTGTVGSLSP